MSTNGSRLIVPESRIIRTTEDESHYSDGSNTYDRVSRVLSTIPQDGIDAWKTRVGEEEATRILNETNRIGTLIHKVTEFNDLNKEYELEWLLKTEPWLIPHWLSWWEWVTDNVECVLAVERTVTHHKYRIAGRLDRIVIMVGDKYPSIADIKSSDYVSEKHRIQVNGYKDMYNEEVKRWNKSHKKDPALPIDRCIIVNLPRVSPGERKVKDVASDKDTARWRQAVEEYVEMMQ